MKEHIGFFPLHHDKAHPYATWTGGFTAEECSEISNLGKALKLKSAKLGDGSVYTNIRKTTLGTLPVSQETTWIYDRLTHIINELNGAYFKFDLLGFGEGLQYAQYDAPDGHVTYHMDNFNGCIVRKLSLSLQLSEAASYEGGDLEVYKSESEQEIFSREIGSIVVFPSYMTHRVTPVTKGRRESLVTWITGPQFR